MKGFFRTLLFFSLFIFHPAFCQTPLKVGIINGAPVSYQTNNGNWHGIIIDIWKRVADENHWKYEFIPMGENTNAAIDALQAKKLDVLIGPLTVTHSRISKVDFSRPFMINKIVVLERGFPIDHFGNLLISILAKTLNIFFLYLGIIFLIIAHIIWFYERHVLKEYGGSYCKGIIHSIWSLLMLLAGSQLVDRPKHHITRFLILIVIFLSIIFSSLVSAAFTSSLTLSLVPSAMTHEKSMQELQNKTFASVTGQTTGPTIPNLDANVILFPDLYGAIHALKTNTKIDAIVGDEVLLKFAIHHSLDFNRLSLTPIALDTDEYAIAFTRASPYLEKFDYSLTKLQEDSAIMPICLRYLAQGDAAACVI